MSILNRAAVKNLILQEWQKHRPGHEMTQVGKDAVDYVEFRVISSIPNLIKEGVDVKPPNIINKTEVRKEIKKRHAAAHPDDGPIDVSDLSVGLVEHEVIKQIKALVHLLPSKGKTIKAP